METVNLGVLFNEARKKYSLPPTKRKTKKNKQSGIYHVYLMKCKGCVQGFQWNYYYKENGKKRSITRVDLLKLKDEVLKRNLKWHIYDEELAKKTARKAKVLYDQIL